MRVDGFQDLYVWQKAMLLCEKVYQLTETMPIREQYGLTSQIRRAAVSIASNIAEGCARQNAGHYRHHLQMSRGSTAEVTTQALLCVRLGYLTIERVRECLNLCDEISRMLNAMIRKL
jgi:four helix bundle protein